MRNATTFILGGILVLGLAAGAMAFGGYGMMGGSYGGWGGHMMQSGYHMGYQNQNLPGNAGVTGPGAAYCPGWQAYRNGQAPSPGTGLVPTPRRGQAGPGGPTTTPER